MKRRKAMTLMTMLKALVKSGFIGLQVHGVGKREAVKEVRFRNIRLKEL